MDLNLTPAAWLSLLERKLDAQVAAITAPMNYYNGIQRLAFATAKFREAFARYFPPMTNNWMKLVVDAPVSRLRIDGFRLNNDPSKPTWDREADMDAQVIWQANNLDAASDVAHTESVKCGVAYVLVSPPVPGEEPLITIEHPAQVFVLCDRANHSRRLAAIKRWVDEDDYGYATVYLPKVLYKFRSVEKMRGETWDAVQWARRVDDPVENNPIGVVPMVPLENHPDLLWGGRSDLEVAMPLQDAINKLCLDMLVSSEYHAFPQRWATGWETGEDAQGNKLTGREVELLVGQSRLVRAESEETKFGSFAPGDVENYLRPIEMYVDHMAAVTRTPAYYLKGKMANMSAEALHAADAGLVDRCRDKIKWFGDGWEEAMRVAFLAKGDTKRGTNRLMESIWADPETKSLEMVVASAVAMRNNLSVPVEMCWEMLGWSPQMIRQAMKIMNLPEGGGPPPQRGGSGANDGTGGSPAPLGTSNPTAAPKLSRLPPPGAQR